MRSAKIVCTIGPSSGNPTTIESLIGAGVDVFRVNFSHGNRRSQREYIDNVKHAARRLGKIVALLQDLPGPKIRVGRIGGGAITLQKGGRITLTTREVVGSEGIVSLNYPEVIRTLRRGERIFLADGGIVLEVGDVGGEQALCSVLSGGLLSSGKGLNVPGAQIDIDYPTDEDLSHIGFGLSSGVDFIALSFVRSASDVRAVRDAIRARRTSVSLVAKIEKKEALQQFDSILKEADAIMVARGDLGIEVPIETVPSVQKEIISKCNDAGKPVIVATQMLLSMVNSPTPTRAEVADVSTAIQDGADAVMLSDETAVGSYPVESVEMLDRIARATESAPRRQPSEHSEPGNPGIEEAVAHAACDLADYIGAAAILAPTQTGSTARRVAKYRPGRPIIAMCTREAVARNLKLCWGVTPTIASQVLTTERLLEQARKVARSLKLGDSKSSIVVTSGTPGRKGSTDLVKVLPIG